MVSYQKGGLIMKKKTTVIVSLFTAILVAGTASACSFGNPAVYDDTSPYEIATEQGFDGTESSWLASVSGGAGSTAVREAYDAAKEEGYEGSFLDFLQLYLTLTTDDSVGLNRALTSAVSVWAQFTELTTTGGGYMRPTTTTSEVTSMGAGVIYSLDKEAGNALVVTNYHVIYDKASVGTETVAHVSDKISLYLYGGEHSARAISATFLGGAMDFDIAVLKVEGSAVLKDSSATAVVGANSDAVTVGERVYAVGNPEGEGLSAVGGIVSVDAEYITISTSDESRTVSLLEIRTDAPVNHGNSGGGLFNADGELLGIVNARTEETGVDAFGYAIPANLALSVAQNIIDNADSGARGAFCATLGITTTVTDSKSVYHEENGKVYVEETVGISAVSAGSPAHGNLQSGDIIYSVEVEGKAPLIITRQHQLRTFMMGVRKGQSVRFVVSRNGEQVTEYVEFDDNSDFTLYN